MRTLITLTESPSSVNIDLSGHVLCVHHKTFPPHIGSEMPFWDGSDITSVEFSRFSENPRHYLDDADALVFLGLSSAMTPGNRTDMVWEILFNKTHRFPKYSVDRFLFRSEPWRAWFHFGFVGSPYRDYTYSYLAQSDYEAYLNGLREDDPFSLEEILSWGEGIISSDGVTTFDPIEVEIITTPEHVHAEYIKVKEDAFENERSIKAVIRRLSEFASGACPQRKVPSPHRLWSSRSHKVIATDLPVDNWLVSQLQHMVSLTNGISAGFTP